MKRRSREELVAAYEGVQSEMEGGARLRDALEKYKVASQSYYTWKKKQGPTIISLPRMSRGYKKVSDIRQVNHAQLAKLLVEVSRWI